MPNTYTALYYHVIFSTKHRRSWIKQDVEERIWSYLGGIARENKMTAMKIGGIEDHVHMLLGAPPTIAPSKAAQLIKGGSSKWIHETFPDLRDFAWQDGYGAFTVSKSNVPEVIRYIENQREHHRTRTFQEEFLAFLKRHGIESDRGLKPTATVTRRYAAGTVLAACPPWVETHGYGQTPLRG